VEASALRAPAGITRLPLATALLRLRSDEQLVALFRSGNDEAFGILHDRYRQRLFAYVRQMLSKQSRQDAEDVLQDVFVRAFGALRTDERAINVRAWLYRVAHNRCIDHLRRPHPAPSEIFEMSRAPLLDPFDQAQQREDLRRLVGDVGRLPDQQRSALLMREIDGMSYADLAAALDVSVPAVKSLLVRARVSLVEAQESRDADCTEIRRDLLASYDRGVKASGRARRHMRECSGCREYRHALRGVRRSFAALTPAGAGPAALLAKILGLGGAGGGAAAASGTGGGAVVLGGAATATACKVAAVVCATALTAGGAVEVHKLAQKPAPQRDKAAAKPAAAHAQARAAQPPAAAAAPAATIAHRPLQPAVAAPRRHAVHRSPPAVADDPVGTVPQDQPAPAVGNDEDPVVVDDGPQTSSGGTPAPSETEASTTPDDPITGLPEPTTSDGTTTPGSDPPTDGPASPPVTGTNPPPDH
jgi:RNA polymerase sigma factor (sigma-70 family)